MAHFAKVENGVVTQVIVIDQDTLNLGHWGDPTLWKQTSYNTRGGVHYGPDGQPSGGVALRGNYAGVGYTYDSVNDVFYPSRPLDRNGVSCDSWTITAPNWAWTNPVTAPTDSGTGTPPKMYAWDEPTKTYIDITPTP